MMKVQNSHLYSGLAAGFIVGFVSYYCVFRRKQIRSIFKDGPCKLVMIVRTDLNLQKGKTASLCSQAAIGCYKRALSVCPEVVSSWELRGQTKIALKLNTDGEDGLFKLQEAAEKMGVVSCIIREEGKAAVLGVGPASEEDVSTLTGHLKLL